MYSVRIEVKAFGADLDVRVDDKFAAYGEDDADVIESLLSDASARVRQAYGIPVHQEK
jgi:hypothetical protein